MTTIQIVRKKLDPAEVGGANTRYDDDCDCTQTTPDGGTTWIDNPGIDPRHSPALQMPARTSSDPRCDAAHSMRVQLERFINTVVTVATQGAGASAILGVLAVFMPEVAILWLLCTEIIGGLLSLGQSTINAAFTTPIYDQLECIFYCHIGADGVCSAGQLAAIEAQIGTDIGGVVQVVMAAYLTLTGEVGFTNSGVVGGDTGDCSGCACIWTYDADLTASECVWTVRGTPPWTPDTAYVAGVGFVAAVNQTRPGFTDSATQLAFETTLPLGTYTKIRIEGTFAYGTSGGFNNMQLVSSDDGVLAEADDPDGFPLEWTGMFTGAPVLYLAAVLGYSGGLPGGSATAISTHFEGIGDNPFGTENCP